MSPARWGIGSCQAAEGGGSDLEVHYSFEDFQPSPVFGPSHQLQLHYPHTSSFWAFPGFEGVSISVLLASLQAPGFPHLSSAKSSATKPFLFYFPNTVSIALCILCSPVLFFFFKWEIFVYCHFIGRERVELITCSVHHIYCNSFSSLFRAALKRKQILSTLSKMIPTNSAFVHVCREVT